MLDDFEVFVSPYLPPGVAYLVQRPKVNFDIPMITSVPEANSDKIVRASMDFTIPMIDQRSFVMFWDTDFRQRTNLNAMRQSWRYA